ncbi:GntR family transcriptional regulator [Modicisalibacter luteus]|uniref:GntR family transcriptional regulator n=1 Tax=Modicisalibacter luteus TaxID=453962 RepID=A0ABV7LZ71_9GAMM|nr:GntR family transcriptional regulator [Halomonas lutea]GHA96180.1 transcriptional regulator [Halomonas lutea]
MDAKRGVTLPNLRQRNLVDQVADVLTEAIIDRRFKPGERLSEMQLSRDMGISRAPLREAARLLESRGFLVSRPGRGFFVRELDRADLADVFDLRLCLERHAFRLLVASFSPEMHMTLNRQVEVMCDVARDSEDNRKIEEDIRFHRMIFEMAGNSRLLKTFNDLAHELRLCMALIGITHSDPGSISTSHWRLIEALASGDPARCEAAVDYHIGIARHYILQGISDPQGTP